MKRLAAFTLVILAGSSLPALAAATAEGASQLTASLQAYFGNEPGVVGVTVDGDAYATRIDFGPYFAKINDPKVSISLTPLDMKLTDLGEGKWQVDQDQPLSFTFKAEPDVAIKASIGQLKSSGVFDEALGTFSTSTSDFSQIAFQQIMVENAAATQVTYTIGSIHSQSTMAGSGDDANGSYSYTFKDLRETIDVPSGPGAPPMQFTVSAPDGSSTATLTGLKPKGVNALAAWFVEHPSPEAITAAQAELKDKLRAALPLWNNVAGITTINSVSVNTMMGQVGMERLDIAVDVNGVVADGRVREAFTVTGLKLPDGIVPPFAANLVPQHFTLDFSVSDFDLATPAGMIIDNLDLTQDPPLKPDMEQQLLGALMPKMAVAIGLGPSEVVANAFHLKAEGSMSAGPVSMPSGSALVQLKGIDDIMAAIQSAPPEMGLGQAAPVVIVAKGMAKPEADGFLSWKIESTPEGSVTINGTDISKIGGGQ